VPKSGSGDIICEKSLYHIENKLNFFRIITFTNQSREPASNVQRILGLTASHILRVLEHSY
jgi:hypothetical protein